MTKNLFAQSSLIEAMDALQRDLLAESGPSISTMRNYRFAILQYRPQDEFALRSKVRALTDRLKSKSWGVLSISLQSLLYARVRATGEESLQALISREKRLFERGQKDAIKDIRESRSLLYLREKIAPHIEGAEGIAADVVKLIHEFADAYPEQADRTLVLIGRAGALYPFFRSSALLKHIDGKTRNIPVVLLYPGERQDDTALSFMGLMPSDRDYRPRIYA